MSNNDEDFEEPQLKFEFEVPELGKTYPVYGMITEFISENPLIIRINNQILGTCNVEDQDKVNIVKDRCLEPGIFITTFDSIEDDGTYIGTITGIIFGRKQNVEFDA